MRNFIIKVDRINSVEQAIKMEQLGVDIISIITSDDVRFNDERVISKDEALKIRNILKNIRISLEIDCSCINNVDFDFINEMHVDFIQPIGGNFESKDLIQFLNDNKTGIVFGWNEVSHDDDPSWILSRYEKISNKNEVFYQLDLLPEFNDSWNFLMNESPKYEEEIQINDIVKIAADKPILVSTNFDEENILSIKKELKNVKGYYFVLGEKPNREDMHFFDLDKVQKIIKQL